MKPDIGTYNTTPPIHVAPSPHIFNMGMTTQRMMGDVLVALGPVVFAAIYYFRWFALKQLLTCLVACLVAEAVFTRMRTRTTHLGDLSASVTGVILGLSLPATAPWYIGAVGGAAAIGIGKTVFGGLGMNVFNPAMVGRAFVMIAFAGDIAASGYIDPVGGLDVLSQATPLTAYKQTGTAAALDSLFWGNANGSIGETSALACLLGGGYLCFRRVASWQIPAGVLISAGCIGGIANLFDISTPWTVFHQLMGGAMLFGAFFIATDPVTSPLSPRGKWIFGVGIGALVMLLRFFSGYPEGIMFAVLLMNAVTPLINRWSIPRPFGGV